MNEFTSKITLIDGTELECYPVVVKPEILNGNELSLDTSGEYLHTDSRTKPNSESQVPCREHEAADKLFYKHIHLFLANADKILSDSRMFLAPVGVVNGLAYTGTSGFRNPTLGVYIEWWLYHRMASIDADGYPVWHIAGSPLSGANACSSVDRNGKTQAANLNGRFAEVWQSFMEVNSRYDDAKGRYLAYELQEVIDILEGVTDEQSYFMLHLRLEKTKYDNYIGRLRNALRKTQERAWEYEDRIRQLLITQHLEAAEIYYNKCLNLRTVAILSREYFRSQRIDMRKSLRKGILDNRLYQQRLTPLRRRAKEAESESRSYEYEGLREIFGDDARLMSFDVIEMRLAEIDKNNQD